MKREGLAVVEAGVTEALYQRCRQGRQVSYRQLLKVLLLPVEFSARCTRTCLPFPCQLLENCYCHATHMPNAVQKLLRLRSSARECPVHPKSDMMLLSCSQPATDAYQLLPCLTCHTEIEIERSFQMEAQGDRRYACPFIFPFSHIQEDGWYRHGYEV